MKRGEIWTLQDDRYASKARPVVVLQSELTEEFDSVVLALFTVPRSDLGRYIGTLSDAQLHDIARALASVLGITTEDVS